MRFDNRKEHFISLRTKISNRVIQYILFRPPIRMPTITDFFYSKRFISAIRGIGTSFTKGELEEIIHEKKPSFILYK